MAWRSILIRSVITWFRVKRCNPAYLGHEGRYLCSLRPQDRKRSAWDRLGQRDYSPVDKRPVLMLTTLLEMLQDKYPGQHPDSLRWTIQRGPRVEAVVWWRVRGYVPAFASTGLRAQSGFTEQRGGVITINGKLLAHKFYHFRLEWCHWCWMRVVLGSAGWWELLSPGWRTAGCPRAA